MTREERAREHLHGSMPERARLLQIGSPGGESWLIQALLTFADAEAAAMRERAAGVADAYAEPTDTPDDFTAGFENAARKLARRIRALPATGEVGRG